MAYVDLSTSNKNVTRIPDNEKVNYFSKTSGSKIFPMFNSVGRFYFFKLYLLVQRSDPCPTPLTNHQAE